MDNKFLISYNFFEEPFQLKNFDLYQIGRIFCNEDTLYPNHFHEKFFELTVVTGGEGMIYTNNFPLPVKKGDIYLSCIYDIHKITTSKTNPLTYDFIAFYPKDPELLKTFKLLTSRLTHASGRIFHSAVVSSLIPLAINEISNLEKNFSLNVLDGLMWEIAVYTARNFFDKSNVKDLPASDKNLLCFQIMEYISANIENITSLNVLADKFHYSYSWLSALFKKTTSFTIVDFYNLQRLTVAKNLILKNEMNLSEIAEKVNFSSAFALSKAFKKQFGCSPMHFRKIST